MHEKRSEFSFGGVAKGESPSRKGAIREPYPQCRKARADAGLVANHLFHSDVAKDIRITFRASGINRKMMKNKQSVQFLKYCDWVANYVTSHTKISYKLAKEKHVEIIGAMKSPRAWSNFSGRVRKRINLDYLKA